MRIKNVNPLVMRYGSESMWVTWRYKEANGRKTKIPHQANGQMAASTNPDHWSTFDEIASKGSNVGIVFRPDRLLLGIDLDHVLVNGKIEHEEAQSIFELVAEADTYTEVSPSGEGLHLYLEIDAPLSLVTNRKGPYEAYTDGRYFTVTLDPFGEPRDVRKVSPEEAMEILSIIGYPWGAKEAAPSEVGDKEVPSPRRDADTIVRKMLSAKNGQAIEKLMGGDVSGHDDDNSKADMAFLTHLAFWTGRDASMMESIWTSSPLGQREKTQERKDYRDRTIAVAISQCKEVYETKADRIARENPEIEFLFVISKEKDRILLQNTENMCRILRHHADFEGSFRYDSFSNSYETRLGGRWRPLEDNDAVEVQTAISILFPDHFGKVGKDMVYDAVIKVSKENAVDSATDYVTSLVWDGEARLDSWLSRTYGTPDDAYHRAVGSNWLKGLVKRIVEPGCKFDYVLVLEGAQGSRKSTSLSVLGGPWHVETTMSTENKDFFMQFHGKTVIEFSEGETLSRTEVKRMKAIITTQTDKYRQPYERASKDYPRRCVFAMTTNQEEYLKDETGNRRWLPVKVMLPEADTDWLAANRDQLYAEAYHRVVTLGETVHEFPKEETLAHQDARRVTDANQDIIVSWYFEKLTPMDRNRGVTVHQVYQHALNGGFSTRSMDKYTEMRITDVLKGVLGLERVRTRLGGAQVTVWNPREREAATTLDEMMAEEKF